MILAFNLGDLITVPFGYLLSFLYELTTNYGVALILFAIIVRFLLLPATAKGKRSTMKMSRLTPRIQEIQTKYANDQQKQSEALQALYKEEGVSMGGGCLWSFLPLLILFPLYAVVRQPIMFILHETLDVTGQIMNVIKDALPDLIPQSSSYYEQMIVAPKLPELAEQLPALRDIAVANADTFAKGVDFTFLGINLASIPNFNIFAWDSYGWKNFGLVLIPLLSAASQVLSMFLSQRMNNSLVTDEKGLEDKETAKKSQANQTSKTMMWISPLMSLWIGFTVPAALSLYWLAQGLVTTVTDMYLTKKYRKIYDAEDAERLKKHLAQEALEEEKERIRAQRRAENPDGITTNTSKKKLQQAKQKEEEVAKAAAAREYAAKKGVPVEEKPEKTVISGIPSRPYCKGRNYDPNRYRNTEE